MDYDEPEQLYVVHDYLVVDGTESEMTRLFRSYDKAKKFFDGLVEKDVENHDGIVTTKTEHEEKEGEYAMYERWDTEQFFCYGHYTVTLTTYEEDMVDRDVPKLKKSE